jgi:hypothetical protein
MEEDVRVPRKGREGTELTPNDPLSQREFKRGATRETAVSVVINGFYHKTGA